MAIEQVQGWLRALGTLTAATMAQSEADAKVGVYAPLLAEHFPVEAFTRDSLEHVASQCKFFPAYGEVVQSLGAWWRENRPRNPAIGYAPASRREDRQPPSEADQAAVRATIDALKRELFGGEARRALREVKPAYLTPVQLKARYLAEGLALPPYLVDVGLNPARTGPSAAQDGSDCG